MKVIIIKYHYVACEVFSFTTLLTQEIAKIYSHISFAFFFLLESGEKKRRKMQISYGK